MLELKGLRVSYGNREVLRGVDALFPDGALTVILGPNGCGKTTLLRATDCLLPSRGGLLLNGSDLRAFSPRDRARHIALMPQLRQTPAMTAEELVLCARYPFRRGGRPSAEDAAAAEDALERCGLGALRSRPLSSLSGGERQRAYFAMALAQNTEVLLLDEPTTYLDPAARFELFSLCRQAAETGKCVVAVTHELSPALRYADRVLLLREGTAAGEGTPHALRSSGVLEEVFGVRILPAETERGTEYLITEKD